jgi:hypothetical protein
MGDNQTRSRTVAGGVVVDQWLSANLNAGAFEITIESLDTAGCSVAVDVVLTRTDGSLETLTFVEVAPSDILPSGPHHFVVAGVIGGPVVLRALPLSDADPGVCPVSYTFKWAG